MLNLEILSHTAVDLVILKASAVDSHWPFFLTSCGHNKKSLALTRDPKISSGPKSLYSRWMD